MTEHSQTPATRSSRPVWLGKDERQWDHVRIHLTLLRDERIDAYAMAVYIGLAAHAEVHSGDARPSAETLAKYGGMSERKARSCIDQLVETGYIRVEERKGKASLYTVLPPPRPLHTVPGSEEADPGTTCRAPRHTVPDTPAPGADEQEPGTRTLLEEPPRALMAVADANDGFEAFWNLYPPRRGRKLGKSKTRQQWARLTRAQRVDAMACLTNYAAVCAAGELAKDPERWLRPDVWPDWREAPTAMPSGPSPRQQRKAAATEAFVGGEQPTGTVGAAFFGRPDQMEVGR